MAERSVLNSGRPASQPADPGDPLGAEVFRAVFESSHRPLLLMAADPPRYTMLTANEAHAKTFSTTREALAGRGLLEVFPPNPPADLARFMDLIRTSLDRVMATGAPDQMPVGRMSVRSADGEFTERYWTATHTPILRDGVVTHIVSASQDVTGEVQERRSEQARRLLMREVDHRARNALTVVQSLIRLSTADTVADLRAVLDGRIESLARAQTSLAARKWEGALLDDVVADTLAALAPPGRVRTEGPRVVLPAGDVQALGMILHELATNAAKYGSLSRSEGSLGVSWRREAARTVRLTWEEQASFPIEPPTVDGFGSRLIRQLATQLRGAIAYDWRPSGLVAELAFKLRAEEDAPEEPTTGAV